MDANDQDDIIKKVKEAGNDDGTGESDDDNSDDTSNGGSDGDNVSGDFGGADNGDMGGDSPDGGEVNEETEIFLANPKKNNMFTTRV